MLLNSQLHGKQKRKRVKTHPGLSLEIAVRDRLGDPVAEGFDFAVRFGEPEPSTLIGRRILQVRVLTCASPSYLKSADARISRSSWQMVVTNAFFFAIRRPVIHFHGNFIAEKK